VDVDDKKRKEPTMTKAGILAAAAMLAAATTAFAQPDPDEDWGKLAKEPKFGILEAIDRGMKTAEKGVMFCAELEPDKGTLVYSLDVVQDKKMRNVVIDARSGEVIEDIMENEDHSKVIKAMKLDLKGGIQAAEKACPGTPIYGILYGSGDRPQIVVKVVADGKMKTVVVNGTTGEAKIVEPVLPKPPQEPPKKETAPGVEEELTREYTDKFPEDKADLGPTGRNPYFFLEPGHYWVFEGKDGAKGTRVIYTMLDKTKVIDGVECRAMEARELKNGEIYEITLDYFAISKKTSNVYYFGEDVDMYKDGKVVGHDGSWLSGKNGARYGLMVPAVPLIGARHYQEIAPGVAMDRVEIMSTTEEVTTPRGTFKNVLKQRETNPVEPGHVDFKYYAPEVGFMVKEEEDQILVEYGRKDK
jgi:uncharacterized membrane protein YkoI